MHTFHAIATIQLDSNNIKNIDKVIDVHIIQDTVLCQLPSKASVVGVSAWSQSVGHFVNLHVYRMATQRKMDESNILMY